MDIIYKWHMIAEFEAGVSIYSAAAKLLDMANNKYAEDSRYDSKIRGFFNDTLIYACANESVDDIIGRYWKSRD